MPPSGSDKLRRAFRWRSARSDRSRRGAPRSSRALVTSRWRSACRPPRDRQCDDVRRFERYRGRAMRAGRAENLTEPLAALSAAELRRFVSWLERLDDGPRADLEDLLLQRAARSNSGGSRAALRGLRRRARRSRPPRAALGRRSPRRSTTSFDEPSPPRSRAITPRRVRRSRCCSNQSATGTSSSARTRWSTRCSRSTFTNACAGS